MNKKEKIRQEEERDIDGKRKKDRREERMRKEEAE